jgi:hypothetical protein
MRSNESVVDIAALAIPVKAIADKKGPSVAPTNAGKA